MKYLLIIFSLLSVSCSSLFSDEKIAYEPLEQFRSKDSTPPSEGFVMVDGMPCLDVNGRLGACSVKIDRGGNLEITLTPKQYPHSITLQCSRGLKGNVGGTWDLPAGVPFIVNIGPDNYDGLDSFVCIGEVFPNGREGSSHMWEIRVRVEDLASKLHINLYKEGDKTYAVLGKHALYSLVLDAGQLKELQKETVIELKSPDSAVIVVETYNGRVYSYIGIDLL